ncbi:hypothetical protein TNCV_948941 [Trichonephila clavipes]|nr:hypothetical protein TNCV_948941 [Trichonephila clavipes]
MFSIYMQRTIIYGDLTINSIRSRETGLSSPYFSQVGCPFQLETPARGVSSPASFHPGDPPPFSHHTFAASTLQMSQVESKQLKPLLILVFPSASGCNSMFHFKTPSPQFSLNIFSRSTHTEKNSPLLCSIIKT